jgi:hypothetical protein
MTSVFCGQCGAPVSEAAKFCLKCGAHTGRRPASPFKFISILFFVLIGALFATSLLLRLTSPTPTEPRLRVTDVVWLAPDRDAIVIADSFCSDSDAEIQRLYALIAQHHRNAAAALVVRDSVSAVTAGTVVHELERNGRLSHVRVVSSDSTGTACWIPTVMLSGTVKRGAATTIGHPVR